MVVGKLYCRYFSDNVGNLKFEQALFGTWNLITCLSCINAAITIFML